MPTIYNYKNEFDRSAVIGKINEIADKIEQEEAKEYGEYDKERVRRLIYEQFYQGLKLSIR